MITYNIDRMPPFFSSLSDVRKAAISRKESGEHLYGFPVLAKVYNNKDSLVGVVLEGNEEHPRIWFEQKTECMFVINEDGSIISSDVLMTDAQAKYYLMVDSELVPFNYGKMLVQYFYKNLDEKHFKNLQVFDIYSKEKTFLGHIFAEDRGMAILHSGGIAKTVNRNGYVGNIRKDIFLDEKTKTVYMGGEAIFRNRIAAMNSVLQQIELAWKMDGLEDEYISPFPSSKTVGE